MTNSTPTYHWLFSLIFLLSGGFVHAQFCKVEELSKKAMAGDMQMLLEIAAYVDSSKLCTVFDEIADERSLAIDFFNDYCHFTPEQFYFTQDVTAKEIQLFLKQHWNEINFSQETKTFLITPYLARSYSFVARPYLTDDMSFEEIYHSETVKLLGYKTYLDKGDPTILRQLALYVYHVYPLLQNMDYNELVNVFHSLTQTQIGITLPSDNEIYWIDGTHGLNRELGLSYYLSFSNKYFFNRNTGLFERPDLRMRPLSQVEWLVKQLDDRDSLLVRQAFDQLLSFPVDQVDAVLNSNTLYVFSTNPFLPVNSKAKFHQLGVMQTYFRELDKSLVLSDSLLDLTNALRNESLNFKERRQIEDSVLAMLDLNSIGAFEFQLCLNRNNGAFGNSGARILDIFYSKFWDELISNDDYVREYLKKSTIFSRMEVTGCGNNYMRKMLDVDENKMSQIKAFPGLDSDMVTQLQELAELKKREAFRSDFPQMNVIPTKKELNETNYAVELKSLIKDSEQTDETELLDLLKACPYSKISWSIDQIEQSNLSDSKESHDAYLEALLFGKGFMYEDLVNPEWRKVLVGRLKEMKEKEIIEWYLSSKGIVIFNSSGTLDFDAIYDYLKYDGTISGFMGEALRAESEVTMLLRYLILVYPAYLPERVQWYNLDLSRTKEVVEMALNYLERNKLLKHDHTSPRSFE